MARSILFSLLLHILVIFLFVFVHTIMPVKTPQTSRGIVDVSLEIESVARVKKPEKPVVRRNSTVRKKNPSAQSAVKRKTPKKTVAKKVHKKPTTEKIVQNKKARVVEKRVLHKKKRLNSHISRSHILKSAKDSQKKRGILSKGDSSSQEQEKSDVRKKLKTLQSKKIPKKSGNTKKIYPQKKLKTASVAKEKKSLSDVSSAKGTPFAPLNRNDLLHVRDQIKECWKIPAGVRNIQQMITKIKIYVRIDGTVASARIVWTSQPRSAPLMKVMAESALRAILSKQCSPLKLPKEKYEQWRELILTFDPEQLLD